MTLEGGVGEARAGSVCCAWVEGAQSEGGGAAKGVMAAAGAGAGARRRTQAGCRGWRCDGDDKRASGDKRASVQACRRAGGASGGESWLCYDVVCGLPMVRLGRKRARRRAEGRQRCDRPSTTRGVKRLDGLDGLCRSQIFGRVARSVRPVVHCLLVARGGRVNPVSLRDFPFSRFALPSLAGRRY
jgi:hypothetical protein